MYVIRPNLNARPAHRDWRDRAVLFQYGSSCFTLRRLLKSFWYRFKKRAVTNSSRSKVELRQRQDLAAVQRVVPQVVTCQAVNDFGRCLGFEPVRGLAAMTLLSIARAALASAALLYSAPGAWAVDQTQMFACMDEQHTLPPAPRASVCACYVEKAGSLSVRLVQMFSPQAIVVASKRSMLNQCISADFAARNDPRQPL